MEHYPFMYRNVDIVMELMEKRSPYFIVVLLSLPECAH